LTEYPEYAEFTNLTELTDTRQIDCSKMITNASSPGSESEVAPDDS